VAAALVEQGGLAINLETYQASIFGRVLDLTYMEYELLRFLATHPRRVSRESAARYESGLEYYGGARTVDVHVRRLRAKLSENAHLIRTVRSVGFKFGVGATARSEERDGENDELLED
jgi:DNA-binding response OmpR family regulator